MQGRPAILGVFLASVVTIWSGTLPAAVLSELVQHAERLLQDGRGEEAKGLLREALRENPADAKALRLIGLLSYSEGRFEEAETHLKEAAKANPASFGVRFALAASLLQQGKHEEALPELEGANRLNPAHPDAAKLLAIEYSKRSRNGDAAAVLTPAMRTAPRDEELHLLLIEAYYRSGAAPESLAIAEKSLQLFPESARLHYWAGLQLGQQAAVSRAKEHLRKAIALDPHYNPTYHALADILVREKEEQEAEALLRAALENEANDPQALIRLGRLLRATGRPQEALEPLRKAAALAPSYALVRLELSRLYFKLGDREKAREEAEAYRQIRETAPDKDSDLAEDLSGLN